MLVKPSAILDKFGLKSRREYACRIFHSLQQTEQTTSVRFFDASFVYPEDASTYDALIRKRLNHAIQCSGLEDCIMLPPLFVRSHEDSIVHLSPNFMLVLCRDGPVFPVLWLRAAATPTAALSPSSCSSSGSSSSPSSCSSSGSSSSPSSCSSSGSSSSSSSSSSSLLPLHSALPETIRFEAATSNLEVATMQTQEQLLSQPEPVQQQTIVHVVSEPLVLQHVQPETTMQPEVVVQTSVQEVYEPVAKVETVVEKSTGLLNEMDEMRYVRDMFKTPLSVTVMRQSQPSATSVAMTNEEQFNKCMVLGESLKHLNSQRMHVKTMINNPNVQPTTKSVLEKMLAQREKDIVHALTLMQVERVRLTEAQEVNEVTRRTLLTDQSADPKWYADIRAESTHLQRCLDCLEASSMSA